MTKDELKQLLETGIKGQGNQIDIGGVLYNILSEISESAVAVEVEDITDIDGEILDALKCGDKVSKVTGKQRHLYNVSYKGEGVGEGICLTYVDAGRVETVSYDYTDDGWAYNSTDVVTLT